MEGISAWPGLTWRNGSRSRVPHSDLEKGPPQEDFKDRGGRKIGGCVGELGLSSGFYTSLQ